MTSPVSPTPSETPPPAASSSDRRQRFTQLVVWVFESFGPLFAFWVALRLGGLVVAIVVSIVTGAVLVVREIARDKRVSPFTAFIALSVATFGALDLHYRTGFFVKLEPALGNTATAIFFLGSVVVGRPIIIEFAEKAAGRALPHARRYLTGWTLVWSAYFFARAGLYVWMAYHLSLERALFVRGALGPVSFGAMFLIERATRWLIYTRLQR